MLRPLTLIVLALLSGANAYATNPTATNSGPMAITSDDRFIWVVNRDNNTVSVLKVDGDANIKIADIPVGIEPRCVAIRPDDEKVLDPLPANGALGFNIPSLLSVFAGAPDLHSGAAPTLKGKSLSSRMRYYSICG